MAQLLLRVGYELLGRFLLHRFLRPEQAASPQQTQSTNCTRLKSSLADIPIFPPEQENCSGLPNTLKAGIENLTGMAMDDVHVHYNSSKPAEVQALAYTQGTEIHVGPGQEGHLVHEAWHAVQQKQGRVRPTLLANGAARNDDQALEHEADVMGAQVHSQMHQQRVIMLQRPPLQRVGATPPVSSSRLQGNGSSTLTGRRCIRSSFSAESSSDLGTMRKAWDLKTQVLCLEKPGRSITTSL